MSLLGAQTTKDRPHCKFDSCAPEGAGSEWGRTEGRSRAVSRLAPAGDTARVQEMNAVCNVADTVLKRRLSVAENSESGTFSKALLISSFEVMLLSNHLDIFHYEPAIALSLRVSSSHLLLTQLALFSYISIENILRWLFEHHK